VMLRVVGFAVAAVLIAFALVLAWYVIVLVAGGDFVECNRGDCGTLGNWNARHRGSVWLAAMFLGAGLAWWRVFGRRGSADSP
jgi:hypothetical protein